jgi:CHAT domain-containing protein
MTTFREKFISFAAMAVLVTAAFPVFAQSVAMVTDLSGKAALQGGRANLTIMSELPVDARVQLDGGARLTAVYLASGDEYSFSGPAQVQFGPGEPRSLSGAAPRKRATALAQAGKGTTIRVSGVSQAGFVMRGGRASGRIRLLSLNGTKILESQPEFRWQPANGATRYQFRLVDNMGKALHEAELEGASYRLPAGIALQEATAYTWELSAPLSDGRRYTSSGDFSVAGKDLRGQAQALRPAAGAPVAERVLYAAWLEHAHLKDEARKHWQALLADRPDDPALQALAGEAAHPPRTVADVAELLKQYQPDPAQVSAMKARLEQAPPPGGDRDKLLHFYVQRAQAAQGLGMIARQREDLQRALQLVKGSEDEWVIMQDVWIAEMQAGNFATALKIKEDMPRLVGHRRGRLPADYANAAMMYTQIGDLPAARSALRNLEAVMWDLYRAPGWVRNGEGWTQHLEHARAQVLSGQGKYVEAEVHFRKALAAAERNLEIRVGSGDRDPLVPPERFHNAVDGAEQRLANNLILQGRLAEAELSVRNVLQRRLSRLGRYSPPTAGIVAQFARLLNEQGRFRDAEKMALASIEIHQAIGTAPASPSFIGARRQLGRALVAQYRWADALPVFEEMSAAIAQDEALARGGRGDPNWGLALVKTGRADKALTMLERAYQSWVSRVGPAHYETAERRGYFAMALAETGQRQRALPEFQEAVKVLLAQGRMGSEEESGATARTWRLGVILEGYIKLLHDLRNELGARSAELAAEAFRIADAARGQSTQRALAASGARAAANDPALADLIRREQDARQQTTVVYGTLLRLLNAPADQRLPQVEAQMRARIQELEKERRALIAEVEQRFPAYANLVSPQPATLEQARAALREGEVLLSVLSTEERTYVWAVPRAGAVLFHAAPLGNKALSAAVGGLRKALDPGKVSLDSFPEFDVAAAHRLYAGVLKPVESAWKGAHTLMVVADGALAQLPFSVLPTEAVAVAHQGPRFSGYAAVPWLARQIAVSQLPAVNTLVTLRRLPAGNPSRAPFSGFGDPQFGPQIAVAAAGNPAEIRMRSAALPKGGEGEPVEWVPYSRLAPLPDTRDEILAIAAALKADPQRDVFLGAAASRQSVKEADLSRRRIIAFATHGLVAGDFPSLEQPALALSAPSGIADEGLLTLDDILSLKLDADWVVLSACNTAAGDGQGAEAISGLGRGFFYAGSRALLVTHWPVETRAARALVEGLFERYTSESMSRAEALRQASLAVMQQTAQDAGGKPLYSYAHPLFWAPYALVGDGGR